MSVDKKMAKDSMHQREHMTRFAFMRWARSGLYYTEQLRTHIAEQLQPASVAAPYRAAGHAAGTPHANALLHPKLCFHWLCRGCG